MELLPGTSSLAAIPPPHLPFACLSCLKPVPILTLASRGHLNSSFAQPHVFSDDTLATTYSLHRPGTDEETAMKPPLPESGSQEKVMAKTRLMTCWWTFALTVACVWPLAAAAQNPSVAAVPGREELSVTVRPGQGSYTLGEVVELEVALQHAFGEAVVLPEAPDVKNGRLQVHVAGEDSTWKEYVGPGWGLEHVFGAPPYRIEAGETYRMSARLLFNYHPETAHLNPLYAQQVDGDRGPTAYLFETSGTYQVKAVVDLGEEWGRLESAPATLRILPPQGPDLEVWKVLRGDAELGYFLQTGGPKGHPRSDRSRAQAAVLLGLAEQYPEARHTAEICRSLEHYWATLHTLER